MRQQLSNIDPAHMHPGKHVTEIVESVDSVQPATVDESVEYCSASGAFV